MHITVWPALFMYFVSQWLHRAILTLVRFLFRSLFYRDLFLFFFGMISEISITVRLSLYMIVINNLGVCS